MKLMFDSLDRLKTIIENGASFGLTGAQKRIILEAVDEVVKEVCGDGKMKFTPIDGVNYVRKTTSTPDGDIQLEGLTARGLIKTLQQMDPDDLVCYMAEQTEETKSRELLIGCIAGVLGDSPHGVAFIVGPEAVRALSQIGAITDKEPG